MSTLAEMEAAVDGLAEREQEELLNYLQTRLEKRPAMAQNGDSDLMKFAGTIRFDGDAVEIQRKMRAEWE